MRQLQPEVTSSWSAVASIKPPFPIHLRRRLCNQPSPVFFFFSVTVIRHGKFRVHILSDVYPTSEPDDKEIDVDDGSFSMLSLAHRHRMFLSSMGYKQPINFHRD